MGVLDKLLDAVKLNDDYDEDDDEFFDDVVELRREREVFPFGGKRHVIVLTTFLIATKSFETRCQRGSIRSVLLLLKR